MRVLRALPPTPAFLPGSCVCVFVCVGVSEPNMRGPLHRSIYLPPTPRGGGLQAPSQSGWFQIPLSLTTSREGGSIAAVCTLHLLTRTYTTQPFWPGWSKADIRVRTPSIGFDCRL